jgi:hypothetical protein
MNRLANSRSAATLIVVLMSAPAALTYAADDTSTPIADRVQQKIETAAAATKRGVDKAVDATAHGLDKAGKAIERTANKASTAVGHTADKAKGTGKKDSAPQNESAKKNEHE